MGLCVRSAISRLKGQKIAVEPELNLLMKKQVLYKYFGGSRNFFEELLIRFSPRSVLNDPFEVRPSVESMAMFFQSSGSFNDREYKDILNEVRKNQEKYFHMYYGIPMLNHLGILCLTESKRNLLMWSHYADSHKGYVVGFDTSHEFFNNYRKTELWYEYENIGKVLPVRYDSFRSESVGCFTDWYFQKSDEWIYEKEHRLVLPLVSCDLVRKTDPAGKIVEEINDHNEIIKLNKIGHFQHLCLFKIPKEAIVSVTLGADIHPALQREILSSIADLSLNPFSIEIAKYSESRFELEI